jgi:hypothetical protein
MNLANMPNDQITYYHTVPISLVLTNKLLENKFNKIP